jgi:predicted metallopeptidase
MQKTIGVKAYYALEFIHERFDKMSEEDKIKVIIHELMHIPNTFGGGFRHHDWVTEKNVNLHYKTYKSKKQEAERFENRMNDKIGIEKQISWEEPIILEKEKLEVKKFERKNWFGL